MTIKNENNRPCVILEVVALVNKTLNKSFLLSVSLPHDEVFTKATRQSEIFYWKNFINKNTSYCIKFVAKGFFFSIFVVVVVVNKFVSNRFDRLVHHRTFSRAKDVLAKLMGTSPWNKKYSDIPCSWLNKAFTETRTIVQPRQPC